MNYNLITERWLICRMLDGEQLEFSLEELLLNLHNIRDLVIESPIEEISVKRLLQAFFIIFTRSCDSPQLWKQAADSGKLDSEIVKSYFELHRSKFDLFDKERPFYQHTDTLGSGKSPMILLFQELSSNNNATLFDHNYNKKEMWLPLKKIAPAIIAQQAFVFGGGVSKPFNFRGSALSGASIFWITGDNLYESLLLNTPFLPSSADPIYSGLPRGGKPAWDRDLIKSEERSPDDYIDYLTYQARRIKIEIPKVINESNYNSETKEVFCSLEKNGFSISRCQGDYISEANTEPMIAQRYMEKEKRHYPYKLAESREPWRDSELLYTGYYDSETVRAPKILIHLKSEFVKNYKNHKFYQVTVFTVNNDSGQPKIIKWRRSFMPFYPDIMVDESENILFETMKSLIVKTENISKLLYAAVFKFCTILKNPDKPVNYRPTGDEQSLIKSMTEKLSPQSNYWKTMETIFYNSLRELVEIDINDDLIKNNFYDNYKSKCFNTAKNAYQDALYNAGSAKAYSIGLNTFFNNKQED